jgi:hypothetical protein
MQHTVMLVARLPSARVVLGAFGATRVLPEHRNPSVVVLPRGDGDQRRHAAAISVFGHGSATVQKIAPRNMHGAGPREETVPNGTWKR